MVLSTSKLAYNEDEFQVLSVVRRLVDPTGQVLYTSNYPPTLYLPQERSTTIFKS